MQVVLRVLVAVAFCCGLSTMVPAAGAAEPETTTAASPCGIAGYIGLEEECEVVGDVAGAVTNPAGAGAEAAESLIGAADDVRDTVGGVRDAVGDTMEFLSDPLYYLASAAQDGARSLATDVLPAMQSALQPDLSLDWWTSAYMVTFALAILMWVIQLLWAFVQTARGQMGPSGLAEVIGERTPLFFIGALFGPAVGVFALAVTGALTRSVIEIFLGDGSADGASATGLGELIQETDPDRMPGGDFVALILYSAMAVGLLFVLITLAIMLVMLYLSGIAFPLVWSWVTNPQHAAMGWKVVHVWAGILLTQPLLFLMLGGAIRLADSALLEGQIGGTGEGAGAGLRTMIALLVAVVALWMAAFTPVLLVKFAPITPSDAGSQGVGWRDLKSGMGGGIVAGSLASVSGRLAGGGGGGGRAGGSSRSAAGAGSGGAKSDPSGGRALESSLLTGGGPGGGEGPAGGRGSSDESRGGVAANQGGRSRGGSSESGSRSLGEQAPHAGERSGTTAGGSAGGDRGESLVGVTGGGGRNAPPPAGGGGQGAPGVVASTPGPRRSSGPGAGTGVPAQGRSGSSGSGGGTGGRSLPEPRRREDREDGR